MEKGTKCLVTIQWVYQLDPEFVIIKDDMKSAEDYTHEHPIGDLGEYHIREIPYEPKE